VHLGRERAEGHAGGGETLTDLLDGLDLVDRDGRAAVEADLEQVLERDGLVIVALGLPLLVAGEVARLDELVHRGDDLRVPAVELAFAALVHAVIALGLEGERSGGRLGGEGASVAHERLFGDLQIIDAADGRGGAGEALGDDLGRDAEGLEDLRAAVAGEGADAHLRHDLVETGVDRVAIVGERLGGLDGLGGLSGRGELGDGAKRERRVDGVGAEAEERGDLVDFAGLAGLGDEVGAEAEAGAHELLVHGADGEEHRDRGLLRGDAAVGDDEDLGTVAHGLLGGLGEGLERGLEGLGADGGGEVRVERDHATLQGGHVGERGELVVEEDRRIEFDEAGAGGELLEETEAAAEQHVQRHDRLFADGVDGRVGDLREELLEIGVEQARAARENGERRVVAHRAGGLGALSEGGEDHLHLVGLVAEGELAREERLGRVDGGRGHGAGAGVEIEQMLVTPLAVVRIGGDGGLHLAVVEELLVGEVDRDHAARAEAAGLDDLAGEVVHEAGFGGQDDVAVVEDLVAGGAQAVAVERGADDLAVGEHDGGGAVPRLKDSGVVAVEGAGLGREGLVLFPGRRHHHHASVQGIAAAEGEELEGVVEGGGVGAGGLDEGLEVVEAVAPDAVRVGVFAGAHQVAVAADGVDLAVVRHHPERMGQVPGREGVGRVALVEEREGGGEERALQIEVELLDLRGGEQALVDDGAAAEGANVEALDLGAEDETLGGALGEVELALEVVVGGLVLAGDEGLDDDRERIEGLAAEAGGVGRDLAPAEEGEPFGLHGGLDDLLAMGLRVVVTLGQENHANAEVGVAEEGLVDRGEVVLEELDRKLGEHAGAVAGNRVGVDRAAVGQGFQRRQGTVEHVVGALAGQLGDEANAAGIVFLISGIERRRNDLGHGNVKGVGRREERRVMQEPSRLSRR